jgi:hypothetical protein
MSHAVPNKSRSLIEPWGIEFQLCFPRERRRTFGDRSTRILFLLFLGSLLLVNPWVRGDGVGYYAYIRSLLVEHRLDFANDWRGANESFNMGRVHSNGTIDQTQYTRTGHLNNHFSVGPSMLWAPFLVPVHLGMSVLNRLGLGVQANGFSKPYVLTMAIATALYGFLGLWLSFRLACFYVDERWALLATLGMWFASSLPIYMYFNPSWSHAQSVFIVACFLWHWHHTRKERTFGQWIVLGLISGLMLDVYYANIALLIIPLLESLASYWSEARARQHDWRATRRLFAANILYCFATVVAFLPTLISRKIIYGHVLELGYGGSAVWHWKSPQLMNVLISSDHGLLVWTPIVILAVVGVLLFLKYDRKSAAYLIGGLVAFYYLIASDPCWDGISSFGNRKFLSLTPFLVLGLSIFFSEFARFLKNRCVAMTMAGALTAVLITWNLAFIFQWGTHMVPSRGPISWSQMAHNQIEEVPRRLVVDVKAYIQNRRGLMQRIEQEDVTHLKMQLEASKNK